MSSVLSMPYEVTEAVRIPRRGTMQLAAALLLWLASLQQPGLAVLQQHAGHHQQLHHADKCQALDGPKSEQCLSTEAYQQLTADEQLHQGSSTADTQHGDKEQLLAQQQQISALQTELSSLQQEVQELTAAVVAQQHHIKVLTTAIQTGRTSGPEQVGPAGQEHAGTEQAMEKGSMEASTGANTQPVSRWVRASAWLDHFLLLSVLKPISLERSSRWTSAAPLHVDLAHPASEKAPRYIAMGGNDGSVHIYSTRGGHVAQVDTGSSIAVTALGSFPLRRNESVLVTGHADGEVRMHALAHASPAAGPKGGFTRVTLKHVLPPGISRHAAQAVPTDQAAAITHIQPIRSSPRTTARRQVAVWDATGWMRLQRENGSVRLAANANSSILATTQSGTLIVGLTDTQAVVHRQQLSSGFKSVPCRGLNGTRMLSATFDPARPFRAYALNDAQQLLMLMVPHEGKPSICKVVRAHSAALITFTTLAWNEMPFSRTRAETSSTTDQASTGVSPMNSPSAAVPGSVGSEIKAASSQWGSRDANTPISMAALRGYLVISHRGGAALLNVSAIRMPSTPVLSEPWDQLTGMLGIPPKQAQAGSDRTNAPPLLAASSTGGGMVLLGLPGEQGMVVLESDLPLPQSLQQTQEQGSKGVWSQPIFLGVMILVGIWQFTRARNRVNHYGMGPGMSPMGGPRSAGSMGMDFGMGGRMGGGGRAGTALAYEAALARLQRERQKQKRGGAARGLGRARDVDMDDDEDDEDELLMSDVRQQRAQHQAFGGFPGPRSVQRAMRMGIPPIIENQREGLSADGMAEDDDEDNRR